MILNGYAVLDVFVSLLRLLLALAVLFPGAVAWYRLRSAHGPEGRQALEDRSYLLFLLALLLLGLNIVSWPLLYLLLQSYVTEWSGVMCIYGVTQIGKGSLGTSRFLPGLLQTLQVTKPALVFASGAWFVLYWLNRRTATGPLRGRVLLGLVIFGLLAAGDAAAETAYLVIPKKEESLSVGCCAEAFDELGSSRFTPTALSEEKDQPWIYAAYYGINGAMVLAVIVARRARGLGNSWLALLVLGAALAVPVTAVFLIDIAAPILLHLPYHHCPYDLVPQVPEAIVAVALFLCGTFAVGWASVARWLADSEETRPFLGQTIRRILGMALFGYLGSLVMFSLELALA